MSILRLTHALSLVTDRSVGASFKVGLDAIEGGTGRLLPSASTEFDGEGIAFQPGDLLFGKLRPYLAKTWLADREGSAVGDFLVLRSKRIADAKYLNYVLLSKAFLEPVTASVTGAKMPRTDWAMVKNSTVHMPPLDEQRAIADYLDQETAQIDALVAKQEELIRRLEERRLAVITTTALTGLRHEGAGEHDVARWGRSLAVEPWLAKAPRGWGMERLKNVCLPRAERNVAGTEVMLSLTVKGYLVDRSSMTIQQNASDSSIPRYFVARPNDLVVNPMWLIGGAIGVSDKRGAVSPDYRVFQIDEALYPWYLHAVLRSAPYFDQYTLYTRSNTTFDRRIKQNDLDNLPLPIPPMDEQRAIVKHIDEQTSRIDTLIAKAEEHIALAKERRSALITAAVTGQIDVGTARKAS